MAKHGEPLVVLFSEEVLKINRRGEAVPRVMLLASNALYFLNAETHRMHRKLPLRSLGALRMSELSDNFLAIINPAEYDCLLVCARKTEAVVAVCEAHRAAVTALGMGGEARGGGGGERRGGEGGQGGDGGAELPVELSLRFTYKAGANVVKQVVFTRLDGETNPQPSRRVSPIVTSIQSPAFSLFFCLDSGRSNLNRVPGETPS